MLDAITFRRNLCTAVAAALLLATTALSPAQEIVAHRGASHDAPESTMAAFELAWQQDADAIEGDFYLTRDGQIICTHDRTTGRTADDDLVVAESTLAELRALDVGSWKGSQWAGERPPTLDEVFACVPDGKKIFVEIKCGPEIMDALVEAVERSSLADEQIVVISFNAEVIAAVRDRLPDLKANWLVSYRRDDDTGEWSPTLDHVFSTLERIDATGLSTHANREVIDAAVVADLRSRGYEFHTWTINDVEPARHFAELDVDTVTTDRPAHIREALATPATP